MIRLFAINHSRLNHRVTQRGEQYLRSFYRIVEDSYRQQKLLRNQCNWQPSHYDFDVKKQCASDEGDRYLTTTIKDILVEACIKTYVITYNKRLVTSSVYLTRREAI